MRARYLVIGLVVTLAIPAGSSADVAEVPVLSVPAARGAGLIVSESGAVAPVPKTVDGDPSDWTGTITRYAGTAIYSRGEFVYQDHINDAWGADDGQDAARTAVTDSLAATEPRTYRVEALSQALGEQFGAPGSETVSAEAHYGDVEASTVRDETDIEEVRVAATPSDVFLLVRTIGMSANNATAVVVLVDTEPGGGYAAPGLDTTSAELAFVAVGSTVTVWDRGTVCTTACPSASAATNAAGYTNSVELRIDRSAVGDPSRARIAVATGRAQGTGIARVRPGDARSDLVNVAFRSDEPSRIWMEHDQALALLAGNIDRYLTTVDLAKLERGDTQTFAPRPGYWERIYVSDSPVNREQASNNYHQGIFQHYGVYLPSNFRERGARFPAVWWAHYRGGHAHDAAAWVPGLIRDFGERHGAIMVFPSARGTSSWYVGRGMEDFLEVWDDSMSSLPIDPDRVSMTGYSMGGYASWMIPMLMPDRFAGASPQEGPPTQGLWAGVGPPSTPQNEGDVVAQFTYNLIENARHVPYVIYHGTSDELVPLSGILAMQARFAALGYRHRHYVLDGNEHYTTAVLDVWTEAADYLAPLRRDHDPARVTYRRWPAMEHAASTISVPSGVNLGYRFDRAYWVSDLELRAAPRLPNGKPDPAVWGTIDAESLGRGTPVTTLVPEAGAGVQGTPYEMSGLRWLASGRIAPENRFRATLENLSSARLDLARMGIGTASAITASITTDGPAVVALTGTWGAMPAVRGASATYDGSTLRLSLPSAGTYAIEIAS